MFAIYIWVQSYELSQKFPNVLEKKYNKSGNMKKNGSLANPCVEKLA
jgi:hypothetical protein